MNNEKIQVLFEEVSELKDELNMAIRAANKLTNLNTDAKNVQDILGRFDLLCGLVDHKINAINDATKMVGKRMLLLLVGAFIVALAVGFSAGYYTFIREMQQSVFRRYLQDITDTRIQFEHEQKNMLLAKNKGVRFYSNGVSFPQNKNIQRKEVSGEIVYYFD